MIILDDKSWIKLFRKILDNPVVTKDADHLAIWVFLLLSAAHKEKDIVFNGKRIKLYEGQLITGTVLISKKMKVNQTKVQRILKFFENEKQIDQQVTNKNRLISIVNWWSYQKSDYQNDYQVTNKRLTTDYKQEEKESIYEERNSIFEEIYRTKNIEENTSIDSDLEKEEIYKEEKAKIFDYDWMDDQHEEEI